MRVGCTGCPWAPDHCYRSTSRAPPLCSSTPPSPIHQPPPTCWEGLPALRPPFERIVTTLAATRTLHDLNSTWNPTFSTSRPSENAAAHSRCHLRLRTNSSHPSTCDSTLLMAIIGNNQATLPRACEGRRSTACVRSPVRCECGITNAVILVTKT
jgi:hypothetical protein